MPDERLLTPTEVAAMWHVSPRTIQRYISTGKLSAVRLPSGHYRIRQSDAQAVLNHQGPEPPG
jgi:excisionase family DNA binding protein